jgi:hypothetical protein
VPRLIDFVGIAIMNSDENGTEWQAAAWTDRPGAESWEMTNQSEEPRLPASLLANAFGVRCIAWLGLFVRDHLWHRLDDRSHTRGNNVSAHDVPSIGSLLKLKLGPRDEVRVVEAGIDQNAPVTAFRLVCRNAINWLPGLSADQPNDLLALPRLKARPSRDDRVLHIPAIAIFDACGQGENDKDENRSAHKTYETEMSDGHRNRA